MPGPGVDLRSMTERMTSRARARSATLTLLVLEAKPDHGSTMTSTVVRPHPDCQFERGRHAGARAGSRPWRAMAVAQTVGYDLITGIARSGSLHGLRRPTPFPGAFDCLLIRLVAGEGVVPYVCGCPVLTRWLLGNE